MSEKRPRREHPITHNKFLDWLDGLLFPEEITCLCCETLLTAEDTLMLCPQCMQRLTELFTKEQLEEDPSKPPELDFQHAAFPYADQARQLIILLKFRSVRAAAEPLARWMAQLYPGDSDLIVPVPTGKKRERERGYNQAEVLARHLGNAYHLPVRNALSRIVERAPQSTLTAEQRQTNLSGTIRSDPSVKGHHVLLVDDVRTTGATACECARVLLKAGAAGVGLITAAHTMPGLDNERLPFRLYR